MRLLMQYYKAEILYLKFHLQFGYILKQEIKRQCLNMDNANPNLRVDNCSGLLLEANLFKKINDEN